VHHQSLVDSFGIYETVKLEQSRFFHLDWHVRRLGESARILDLALPASLEEIARWSQQLAATVQDGRGLLRIVAYGSDGVLPAICGLYFKPPNDWPSQVYAEGVWVTTRDGERTWPLAKSTNCLAQALARFHARRQGAYEGLIVDRHGHITEGSTCNVMVVRSGELLRSLAGTALEGVTENIVVQLAAGLGIPVRRTTLPQAEVHAWDEAFITSTTRNVMPIRQVNQVVLPPTPGPITRRLMAAYAAYEAEKGWTAI
jgi:branched-chain amino acid aminotransferase